MAKRVAKPWIMLAMGSWLTCPLWSFGFPWAKQVEPVHQNVGWRVVSWVVQNWQGVMAVMSFVVAIAAAFFSKVQADEAVDASDEVKTRKAVQNVLQPYQPKKAEEQVVKRNIMNTIKKLITEWSLQTEKATIISGRFSAGKTVAVNEALRGVRGVLQFDVKSADWEEAMYKKLRVDDEGMFKEVLRRVRRELEKFPDNPTKFPILLLEVHREVVGGADAMKLVSTTAKTLATDGVDQAPTHVIVSCSSAAFALAFDAGGPGRQQDVWVGGFTRDEAEQLAKLNGCGEDDWTKIQPIVEKCDYRAGDVVDVCTMIKSGMSAEEIEADLRDKAEREVVNFNGLTVADSKVGSKMLHALLESPLGMKSVVDKTSYEPREIAAEIRNKNAHAVLWNPHKKRYFFASEMHREAAETLLGHP